MAYFGDKSVDMEKHGLFDFPQHLYTFIQRMREDESSHDVVFVVGNDRFPAHRCLVGAASPVLRKMLTNGMKETKQREVVLKEVNVSAWKMLLDYIYTGKMELTNPTEAVHVLECVERFQIENLEEVITKYIEHKLTKSNAIEILDAVDFLNSAKLRAAAMKLIVENFYEVCYREEFTLLPFDLVLEVISSDELVIRSELDVFVAVVRWFMWRITCDVSDEPKEETVKRANEELARKVLSLFVECEFVNPNLTERSPLLFGTGGLVESNINQRSELSELFSCVDISKLSTEKLRRVSGLCRKLFEEARTIGSIDMTHVWKFSEKTVDKLVQLHNHVPDRSLALYERVTHRRSEWVSGMYIGKSFRVM